ncbi:hypothetical protein OUZ56_022630 [Daphnia magna]|uniref:Uncharacterized protein n=1 Tax=Daphnia magna TaxID=35525 RepID=A0ABR0AWZ4_9CRUS|nr:hypothetical protein OUZ56_022630 [Daphnia magna]
MKNDVENHSMLNFNTKSCSFHVVEHAEKGSYLSLALADSCYDNIRLTTAYNIIKRGFPRVTAYNQDDFPTCLRNSNLNVECRKTRRQNYSKAAMPIFLIGFSTSINLLSTIYAK